jgi:hypothetical protein
MYAMSAQLQGLGFVGVPLQADFSLDETAMVAAIAQHQPAIVYLAYPNNPTANLWDAQVLRRLIAQASAYGALVVVDEAYQPFAASTWLDEIRHDPAANVQVVLMRTLSKFGLAGVRLGYALAPAALLAQIDKVRPPYNVSVLNAECALFALEHATVFAAQAALICSERERLLAALTKHRLEAPFAIQKQVRPSPFATPTSLSLIAPSPTRSSRPHLVATPVCCLDASGHPGHHVRAGRHRRGQNRLGENPRLPPSPVPAHPRPAPAAGRGGARGARHGPGA